MKLLAECPASAGAQPGWQAIGAYGVLLGAQRAGSATNLSVTYGRLRVDYRR